MTLKRVCFLLMGLLLLSTTLVQAQDQPPYLNPDLPVEQRVDDLLARMNIAQKIGQMTLVEKNSISPRDVTAYAIGGVLSGGGESPSPNTPEAWAAMVKGFQDAALATPLAIPMIYGVDAVHGHNNLKGATIFPQEVALGATRDAALVEQIGRATAEEMVATGIYWDYAPVVAVPQDIRWGRTYEGYGENTDLVSTLATAFIKGLQGDDLSAADTVLATPKHFVGDGGAAWGTSPFGPQNIDRGVTAGDEATLRAIHLPPYQAAIDAGAQSIMISFSSWGGLPMHAQHYLITDVLKGELGFTGFTVSDWQGIDSIAPTYYQAVITSINAGLDMIMVPQDYPTFIRMLTTAAASGAVPPERIDDAVRRILRVKFELGLFEHPYANESLLPTVGSDAHRALARQAVSELLVLLKNDDQTLPLSKTSGLIRVAGRGADDIGLQSGGWTIEWQGKVGNITPGTTLLQGIQNAVQGATVEYNQNGQFDDSATQADIGIAVVGELPYAEFQGDSATLALSPGDQALIERMRAQSKKLVVILLSGRPLIISEVLGSADAFVAAWLPGTEGEGVADVLFGDKPFVGKLSLTWPRSIDQLPFDFAHLPTTGCAAPLFPYDYGLTYNDADSPYLALAVQCAQAAAQPTSPPVIQANPTATPVASAPAAVQMVNDFEHGIWMGTDSGGAGIGLVPWGDTFENVAGNPDDTSTFPQTMLVDYVRVYQLAGRQ